MQNYSDAKPIPLAQTLPIGASVNSKQTGWKRTKTLTGVAAASASMMLPLAGEQAIAYDNQANSSSIQQQDAASHVNAQTSAPAQALASANPQASQDAQAKFSLSGATASNPLSNSPPNDASVAAPLLARAQDGTLRLAYQPPTDVSAAQTQNILSRLVGAAQSQAATAQANRQDYIASKLPAARQEVQQLKQQLADFEAARGQQDMLAYQKVLSSRMSEITEQRTRLDANIERNQRAIAQLKMQLLTVNADLALPAQVLAADTEYQAVWAKLQQAEQNLLEEFSKANINATRLNEIYADYKYHQQWLARRADQAFPSYVTAEKTVTPRFLSEAPAAIDIMQNLVVATHEDQVQQLRQDTIYTVEQRLQGRNAQLVADVGRYEQMKRELTTAEQLVAEYEQAEGSQTDGQAVLVSNSTQSSSASGLPAMQSAAVVSQAQMLAQYFPEGTLPKVLLGIVVAAGAIATAAIQHRDSRQRPFNSDRNLDLLIEPAKPAPAIAQSAPNPDFSQFSLYGETVSDQDALDESLLSSVLSTVRVEEAEPVSTEALVAELLEITRETFDRDAEQDAKLDCALANFNDKPEQDSYAETARTEAELVEELTAIVREPDKTPRQSPVLTAEAIENILGIEVMAKELDDIIKAANSMRVPSMIPSAAAVAESWQAASTEPVKLSVRAVDLFAEQVIRWVLADLGLQVVSRRKAVVKA